MNCSCGRTSALQLTARFQDSELVCGGMAEGATRKEMVNRMKSTREPRRIVRLCLDFGQ